MAGGLTPEMPLYGGHSMTAPLARALVRAPAEAGWNDPARAACWRELGYLHPPDFDRADREHEALCRLLRGEGVEVLELPPAEPGPPPDSDLSLDALYARDPALVTDGGFIELAMGKPARRGEPACHRRFLEELGVPRLGGLGPPGMCEAGDLVWLDSTTVLAGRSYRTDREGIVRLTRSLSPRGVEVVEVPIPHRRGPDTCLHLGSLLSPLDETTVLVDLPWLAVETVELLEARGLRRIESVPGERDRLATNVLALGDGRVLALEGSPRTHDRLRDAGFEVRTYEGEEISLNGCGGPTCLVLPVLRHVGGRADG